MPYALAQSATDHNDFLSKLITFVTSRSCTAAVVNAGGSGYAVNDVLTVSGGTSTIAVELVVTGVSSGAVTTVRISQSGAYTSIPTNPVSVTGGGGTGATFDLTFNTDNGWTLLARSQQAASATVSAGGTGHAINDILTVLGHGDVVTAPTFTITEIGASAGVVAAGGTGYTVNDTLTLSGGTFSTAATFNVDSVSGGVVTGVSLVSAGSYSVTPGNPVATTGGTGTGCTLTVTFDAAALVTLTTAGDVFHEAANPASTSSDGSGVGATLTVTYANLASGNFTCMLDGEGGGSDNIIVGLRTFTDGSSNNLEIRGFTAETTTAGFNFQPGVSPGGHDLSGTEQEGAYVPLDNAALTYWLFVSGRRIIGVIKVGASTYTNFYLGFINPFGTSTDFPYPLYVGGCSSQHDRLFSSNAIGYSGMVDPIRAGNDTFGPHFYRTPDGNWNSPCNSLEVGGGRNALDDFVVWPAGQTGQDGVLIDDRPGQNLIVGTDFIPNTGNPGTATFFMKQTPDSPNGRSLLWPTIIAREGDGGSVPRDVHGELDGVFWSSADIDDQSAIAVSEDTFTDENGERYHIFQNCNRTELFSYFCVVEE